MTTYKGTDKAFVKRIYKEQRDEIIIRREILQELVMDIDQRRCITCGSAELATEGRLIPFDLVDPTRKDRTPNFLCLSCYFVWKDSYYDKALKLAVEKDKLRDNLIFDCKRAKNPRLYRDRAEVQ